jgi:S1-C subfamily serine protease
MRQFLHRLTTAAQYLSPWISLGLAGALVAVWSHPEWLPPRVPAVAPSTLIYATPPANSGPLPAPLNTSSAQFAVQVPADPASAIQGAIGDGPASYASAVTRAAPAVVGINTESLVRERAAPPGLPEAFRSLVPETEQRVEGAGSGVIIDSRGYVVTNQHVIAGVAAVTVQLADGRTAPARVVGSDPDTDLAVLQIPLQHLPVITLGRSDHLRVGDVVLAIGNPLALGQTVTQGIVSATGRGQLGLAMFENFVQTDAAINPGNSGGALVDAAGRLVGINTAVLSHQSGTEGIGFAIPINLVRGVMAELIDNGRVARGWLGAGLRDLDIEVANDAGLARSDLVRDANNGHWHLRGVAVVGLIDHGPGDQAQLGTGDVVLRLDGHRVTDARDLVTRLALRRPGSKVQLSGYRLSTNSSSRSTAPLNVTVTLGERPQDAQQLATRYPSLVPG